MKTVYRTLVLRCDLSRLPPEVAEKIPKLLKVQKEFRRWAAEWVRSGGSLPLPDKPLRRFAKEFLYAGRMLNWFEKKNNVKVKKMKSPLFFDVQLRLKNEHDMSCGILIDVPRKELRIRKWGGRMALPLTQNAVKWILERSKEGGRLVLAMVWIGRSRRSNAAKLYVALIFRREVASLQPKRLLVIDLNALHNGLAWAVVEERRIVTKGILRPNVSKIAHMQKVASKLDSACAKKDKACDGAMAAKSRTWRMLRIWEDEAAKKLVRLAIQYKAAIIADVPFDQSIRELKKDGLVAERKIFLNFGRLRRRIKDIARWYGVSYREERLYSTICPRCGGKMSEQPNRRMRCACGFTAHRDVVPMYWASKLHSKFLFF